MRRAYLLFFCFTASFVPAFSQAAPANTSSGELKVRADEPSPVPNDNPRVVAMVNKGLDDSIIVAKIKASSWTFQLSDDQMLGLRKTGVSARVVAAMVDSSATTVARVNIDDQPVQMVTMGQAKTAGKLLNNLTGDLTTLKENAFLEGGTATTQASPMPEILVTVPKGDSIGNYILVRMNAKGDDRRELSVGTGGGVGNGRTGLNSSSAIRPIRVITRGDNVYQILPLNKLKVGQYLIYVVGSSDEQRSIYGRGYDFSVMR
jgi:hypothetical protein